MGDQIIFGQFNTALAIIGASFIAYFSLKIVLFIAKSVKMFVLRLGVNPKIYGSWAVITGATDGIGKAYAEQLASRGLNVVLMSRTKSKLEEVASEIESKYKVETKIIAVDFTSDAKIYKDVASELADLEIGVLINNVGMSYPFPQYFHELEDRDKLIPTMININCLAATMMTSIILPSMLSRKKGLIVNISSAAGSLPAPLLAVYSATKAYMDYLSRSLHSEYSSKGIIVQFIDYPVRPKTLGVSGKATDIISSLARLYKEFRNNIKRASVLPYFVVSKLSKIRRSSLTVPTAPSFVGSALATVGNESRTFGCFMHNLQNAVTSLMPEFVVDYVAMTMHQSIRKSALKKKQQKSQ